MKLVFVDPNCPAPYDSAVLEARGLGGTEATVIRIARALAGEHRVVVIQHNRTERRDEGPGLSFLPGSQMGPEVSDADHVVFIQKAQDVAAVARTSPARLWLWLHNFVGDEVPFFWQDHLRHRLGIICVSRTHALHTRAHLRRLPAYWLSGGLLARGGLTWLHNPVDDRLAADPSVVRDRHKLVFFSSPHKGLEQVVATFEALHAVDPAFRLHVADPGYLRKADLTRIDHPGIVRVGSLPHHAVMQQVRKSLCVFSPQYKRPETFGLVYAEANALGVPVLAHEFGAAREVLVENNPPIDARDTGRVIATLLDWKANGGPRVAANPDFALSKVAGQWRDFLLHPDAFIRERNRLDA
jgi:glycosyltransferase involved in cell wall biosynthesis